MYEMLKTEEIRIIVLTVVLAFCIISFGVGGYMIFEGWSFLDAMYQTVITISTVGFGEVHPISDSGRVVTIFLIMFAISLLGYFFSRFVTIMVEGRINRLLRGRKMERRISKLKDHFIICGYGRTGQQVAVEFRHANVPFVVLDLDIATFERETDADVLYIVGDSNREEDLERCGIMRAKGLVSVLPHDQGNVYTVLTARGLRPDIHIVTQAHEFESERKLLRAGADRVVSPHKIGGSRIASVMLRPSITHFLDGLARAEEIRLTLVEVEVMENSSLSGKKIIDTGITSISESIIVGLRRKGESIRIRPPVDTVLEVGDQLVLMGQLDALHQVDRITEPDIQGFSPLT